MRLITCSVPALSQSSWDPAEYLSDELAPLCAAIGLMSTTINSVLLPLLFYHCLKGDEAKGDVYFHAFLAALTVLAAVICLKHI